VEGRVTERFIDLTVEELVVAIVEQKLQVVGMDLGDRIYEFARRLPVH
jgi:hypothetical protein